MHQQKKLNSSFQLQPPTSYNDYGNYTIALNSAHKHHYYYIHALMDGPANSTTTDFKPTINDNSSLYLIIPPLVRMATNTVRIILIKINAFTWTPIYSYFSPIWPLMLALNHFGLSLIYNFTPIFQWV